MSGMSRRFSAERMSFLRPVGKTGSFQPSVADVFF